MKPLNDTSICHHRRECKKQPLDPARGANGRGVVWNVEQFPSCRSLLVSHSNRAAKDGSQKKPPVVGSMTCHPDSVRDNSEGLMANHPDIIQGAPMPHTHPSSSSGDWNLMRILAA